MNNPLHLLLLEDRASDAELMLAELRAAGFDPDYVWVDTEPGYLAALDPTLDLILADYHLPQFDGVRALKLMQERGLDIPFILVSGTVGEDIAVEAMKTGAADYMLKDRLARLGQAVEHAIEQKGLRSENEHANEALRESEATLRAVMANSPDTVYMVDLVTRQAFYFQESFLGYGRGELTAPGGIMFAVHPQDRDALAASWQKTIGSQDNSVYEIEYRLQAKNGPWEWIRSRASVTVRLEDGTAARVMVTLSLITERKQAEEALHAADLRYRALIKHASDGISLLGLDGQIKYASPSTQRILGYNPEEAVNFDPAQMMHPDDLPGFVSILSDLIQRPNETVTTQYRFKHKDGSWHWLESTITNLLAEPSVEAVVFNFRDITERKQAESHILEHLEELQRWHNVTLGRENRILELKREVNELLGKAGEPPRYPSAELQDVKEK